MTVANKIIYGNNTLIDLTGDTATASDVKTGIIFHLASGEQTTGTMTITMSDKSATTVDEDEMNLFIYGVAKEPSWFILICANASYSQDYRILHIIYDGASTTVRNAGVTGVGMVSTSSAANAPTVTYSNGSLYLKCPQTYQNYFGAADWELYYL